MYGTRRARHWTLSSGIWFQCTPSYPVYLRSILILHLISALIAMPSVSFPSGFPPKMNALSPDTCYMSRPPYRPWCPRPYNIGAEYKLCCLVSTQTTVTHSHYTYHGGGSACGGCSVQSPNCDGTWGLQAETFGRRLTLYRPLHSSFTKHLPSQPRKNSYI